VFERLERGGKQVVLSTLALPTLPREMRAIREVISAGYAVEANDIATIHLLAGAPHVVGPTINVYNEAALAVHARLGAARVCLSPELSLEAIRRLSGARGAVAIEVFAFGRAPLAVSARCYHARAHGLPKDACQFVCDQDPDGMDVDTLSGQPFLAVNGVQTLGHVVTAATRQVAALRDAGVAALRLSPHTCDMIEVARLFRALAEGRIGPDEAEARLTALRLPGPLSDGYLRGLPGARRLDEAE
jgi:collagenase-like PrtC family protease